MDERQPALHLPMAKPQPTTTATATNTLVIGNIDDISAEALTPARRVVIVNDVEITGTCRGFSKKNRVEGFERCPGFCKGVEFVNCKVDGKDDFNCDG